MLKGIMTLKISWLFSSYLCQVGAIEAMLQPQAQMSLGHYKITTTDNCDLIPSIHISLFYVAGAAETS
jgi:hypothetical protein